jgi:solute carrier family 35, member E3
MQRDHGKGAVSPKGKWRPVGGKGKADEMTGTVVPSSLYLVISLVLNVLSSTLTIFFNKRVAMNEEYRFGTVMAVVQMLIIHSVLRLGKAVGWVGNSRVELRKVFMLSFAFFGYVLFNNLSLTTNTVSFYQVTKLLVTPCVLLIQRQVYDIHVSNFTLFSLVPLVAGSVLFVGSDFGVSMLGLFFSFLAILFNSAYTVFGSVLQQGIKGSSIELFCDQSLVSACLMAPMILLFDDVSTMMEQGIRIQTLVYLFSGSVCAFGVNLSFFMIAKATSPLTVNVIGYLKTCLVLLMGVIVFQDELGVIGSVGVVLTMAGLFGYTLSKIKQAQAPK